MVFIKTRFICNKYFLRQILLTSIAFLQGVGGGGVFAFSSILFPQLKYDGSIILDENQESWLASITTLIMSPMCLISGIAMELFGRKNIIAFAEIMALIGWIITFFAYDYTMLLIARILSGIFTGITYPAFITFLGEVSLPQYRTIFLTAIPIGTTFGTFTCQLLGDYVHWKIVAAIFAFFPMYDFVILLCIKESYIAHLDRNKIDEARKSFAWFRGNDELSEKEFNEVLEDKMKKPKESLLEILKMCNNKEFLVPLGITVLVFLTNEVTATQAIIFYTSPIVKMIKDDEDFDSMATLILNILRIVAVISSLFLVKVTSVRFILISSGYILGVSLLGSGLFMYLSYDYSDYSIFPILSLGTLVLNAVLYSIGLGPLPSVVCGEMFPQATRSIGGSISAAISFLFLFIVVKCMPLLFTNVGSYWTFTIFGICTLIGITASHFVLPYTKNKTLLEINKLYQSSNGNIEENPAISTITA